MTKAFYRAARWLVPFFALTLGACKFQFGASDPAAEPVDGDEAPTAGLFLIRRAADPGTTAAAGDQLSLAMGGAYAFIDCSQATASADTPAALIEKLAEAANNATLQVGPSGGVAVAGDANPIPCAVAKLEHIPGIAEPADPIRQVATPMTDLGTPPPTDTPALGLTDQGTFTDAVIEYRQSPLANPFKYKSLGAREVFEVNLPALGNLAFVKSILTALQQAAVDDATKKKWFSELAETPELYLLRAIVQANERRDYKDFNASGEQLIGFYLKTATSERQRLASISLAHAIYSKRQPVASDLSYLLKDYLPPVQVAAALDWVLYQKVISSMVGAADAPLISAAHREGGQPDGEPEAVRQSMKEATEGRIQGFQAYAAKVADEAEKRQEESEKMPHLVLPSRPLTPGETPNLRLALGHTLPKGASRILKLSYLESYAMNGAIGLGSMAAMRISDPNLNTKLIAELREQARIRREQERWDREVRPLYEANERRMAAGEKAHEELITRQNAEARRKLAAGG